MSRHSAPVAVAVAALRDLGARFVLAEVAGGPAQVALIGALHEQAFADAARIADFVDDGVDLHILRLDLVP